jgi:hypothetical protein
MPIYRGLTQNNPSSIFVGETSLSHVYVGDTLVWQKIPPYEGCIKYGYLYNWYAASDVRNIAPIGWHVPSQEEYETLFEYLGGSSIAAGKLKETGFIY